MRVFTLPVTEYNPPLAALLAVTCNTTHYKGLEKVNRTFPFVSKELRTVCEEWQLRDTNQFTGIILETPSLPLNPTHSFLRR